MILDAAQALLVFFRIEEPFGRRDAREQRIPVLWSEAKPDDLSPLFHREGPNRYYGLVQYPAEKAMVSAERKNMARKVLLGDCDSSVGFEAPDDILQGSAPSETKVKIDHMRGIEC